MLILGAGLLAALASARAADDAPISVGDRFDKLNRPHGVMIDGWEARPALLLRSGYDDNVTLARGRGPSSAELQLRGTIDAERDIGPYHVDLNAALGRTWHPQAPATDWTDIDVGVKATFDLRPRLALYAGVSFFAGCRTEHRQRDFRRRRLRSLHDVAGTAAIAGGGRV